MHRCHPRWGENITNSVRNVQWNGTLLMKFHGSLAESDFYYYNMVPREKKQMDWSWLHCYCFPRSLLYHQWATSVGGRDVHTQGRSDVHHRYHVHTHIPVTHQFHIAVDGLSVMCHLGVVLHSLSHSICRQETVIFDQQLGSDHMWVSQQLTSPI